MAQITHFFAGANSGNGFQNLFSEMVDLEDTYDFMILKGGPGVGKNTFMREIGKTMERAGTPVEYLWCSGDPDSLDGVVMPELRAPWPMGQSPCPGAEISGGSGPVRGPGAVLRSGCGQGIGRRGQGTHPSVSVCLCPGIPLPAGGPAAGTGDGGGGAAVFRSPAGGAGG